MCLNSYALMQLSCMTNKQRVRGRSNQEDKSSRASKQAKNARDGFTKIEEIRSLRAMVKRRLTPPRPQLRMNNDVPIPRPPWLPVPRRARDSVVVPPWLLRPLLQRVRASRPLVLSGLRAGERDWVAAEPPWHRSRNDKSDRCFSAGATGPHTWGHRDQEHRRTHEPNEQGTIRSRKALSSSALCERH